MCKSAERFWATEEETSLACRLYPLMWRMQPEGADPSAPPAWGPAKKSSTEQGFSSQIEISLGSESSFSYTDFLPRSCWRASCRGRRGIPGTDVEAIAGSLLAEHPWRPATAAWGDSSSLLCTGCSDSALYSALSCMPASNSCCNNQPLCNPSTLGKVSFHHMWLHACCCCLAFCSSFGWSLFRTAIINGIFLSSFLCKSKRQIPIAPSPKLIRKWLQKKSVAKSNDKLAKDCCGNCLTNSVFCYSSSFLLVYLISLLLWAC